MAKNLKIREGVTRRFRPQQLLIVSAVVAGIVFSMALGGLSVLARRSPIPSLKGVPLTILNPRTADASGPIVLNGNAELAAFCAGNASMDGLSWDTAYRLENYMIALTGTDVGITIINTDAYLIIQNCTVSFTGNPMPSCAYYFQNVTYARLANCTSFKGYIGLYMVDSSLNYVEDNNITNSVYGIVMLDDSNLNHIERNRMTDSAETGRYDVAGIYIVSSSPTTCAYNFITNNQISQYPIGIYLSNGASFTDVWGNNVSNNYLQGILLFGDTRFTTLERNVVLSNSYCGINISYAIDGVWFPNYTYVYHNWVVENAGGYLPGQIYVSGASNTVTDQNVLDLYTDSDGDGITDYFELTYSLTNPNLDDTDSDTYSDGYEVQYGSNPNDPNSYPPLQHADFLRLLGYCEGNATTLTGLMADVQGNTNLLQALFAYCDNNATILNGVISDLNGNATLLQAVDALATQNGQKLQSLNISHHADIAALQLVVDKLGISVGDTDYDGLNDLDELRYGTSVTQADTDNDGYSDGYEVSHGMDPLSPEQSYVGIIALGLGAGAIVLAVVGVIKKRKRQ